MTNNRETVPEPYTKMIENMHAGDLEMTKRYAELVINDFSDTDYVYNAYVIKNMVGVSKQSVINYKANLLEEGGNNINIFTLDSDIDELILRLEELTAETGNFYEEYKLSIQYLLENYSMANLVEIELPEAPDIINIEQKLKNNAPELSYFAKRGYSVPSKEQINKGNSKNELIYFNLGLIASSENYECLRFSYVDHFDYLSKAFGLENSKDESLRDLVKNLLKMIVELTEDWIGYTK